MRPMKATSMAAGRSVLLRQRGDVARRERTDHGFTENPTASPWGSRPLTKGHGHQVSGSPGGAPPGKRRRRGTPEEPLMRGAVSK
ncbi:MAG: hypothetical protein MZV70_53525 [Desulfobacterales bacterium]|nr:hypothetical protein [Desulfobacterales bacterium]